jgi:hypothetical protein
MAFLFEGAHILARLGGNLNRKVLMINGIFVKFYWLIIVVVCLSVFIVVIMLSIVRVRIAWSFITIANILELNVNMCVNEV